MRIKQIIIQNFQSYKHEIVDNISERINLILGQNGHGKSNIINAVAFVLTDRHPITREEERRAILNNNAIPAIDIISVEIKFDNREKKVPMDSDEISLKRIVTPENKSEHRLNDRVITKHELENILSCCGISVGNAYNIIQQGRITKIAHMSEKELYNLLQEIIGTNQYENKKGESMKTFDQISKEKVKAEGMLQEIKKHIDELATEKELYEDYESNETEATCIEFCIYQKHLTEIQKKIDGLATKYNGVLDKYTNVKNDEIDYINDKNKLKNDIQGLRFQEETLRHEEAVLSDDMRDIQLKKEKIIMQMNNIDTSKVPSTQGSVEPHKAQEMVEELENKLRSTRHNIKEKETEFNQLKEQLRGLNKQLDRIYVNKGPENFRTLQEKKSYYTRLLQEFEEKLQKSRAQAAECQQIIERNKQKIVSNKDGIQELGAKIKTSEAELNVTNTSISDFVQKKSEVVSKMKGLIYKINQDKSNEEEIRKTTTKLQKTLQFALKDNLLYTIETIMETVRLRGIKGVHGLLVDLINIPIKLHICCDIALKNKLFGFVVDSHETADTLLSINREIKGSTINIYPMTWISDLKSYTTEYPGGGDVIVIKDHIKPKTDLEIDIEPLIQYIFGKVLLVRNYQTATMMAQRYKLNCVTSEGELVYAGSYLTKLGFYDVREECLPTYLEYKKARDNLDGLQASIAKAEQDKENLNNQDFQSTQKLQSCYIKRNELTQRLITMKAELKGLMNNSLVLEKINDENLGYISLYEDETAGINNKIELYKREKDNPALEVEGGLKDDEKITVDQLTSQGNTLREKARKSYLELGELQQTYNKTHELIERNKFIQQSSSGSSDRAYETTILDKEKSLFDNQLFNIKKALEDVRKEKLEIHKKVIENEKGMKETEDKQKSATESKTGLEEEIMKINLSKGTYVEAKEAYSRKISQMDHVKSDMVSQFSSKTIKELLTRLEFLRKEKKKFTAKDKALFEKLDALNNKFELFDKKVGELEKNEEDTLELIQKIDSNIQDKISKIFKSFSNHLEKYFSKITRGGKITAKLLKERGRSRRDVEDQKHIAISLNVAFNNDDEEEKEDRPSNVRRSSQPEGTLNSMATLSAGQKTVVATAFIFALQRCDPAPFYFLDEFDAALDVHYRRNIAQVIHENSAYSQYFITTFKTELLSVSDATIYEVSYDGMVSRVGQIEKERAEEILGENDDEVRDERQEGN